MPFNGISFSSASLQALTFKVCQFLVQSLMVSLTWILLFYLNALIFQTLSINHLVSWIFLPACIRLLSVLIFEWAGVFGLFLGALVTSVGQISTISILGYWRSYLRLAHIFLPRFVDIS